jgi:hypothetical protein
MSLSSLLTSVVHGPAHDGETRAGVAMRTLDSSCFAHDGASHSAHASFTLASVVASVDGTLAETAEERVSMHVLTTTPGFVPHRYAGRDCRGASEHACAHHDALFRSPQVRWPRLPRSECSASAPTGRWIARRRR